MKLITLIIYAKIKGFSDIIVLFIKTNFKNWCKLLIYNYVYKNTANMKDFFSVASFIFGIFMALFLLYVFNLYNMTAKLYVLDEFFGKVKYNQLNLSCKNSQNKVYLYKLNIHRTHIFTDILRGTDYVVAVDNKINDAIYFNIENIDGHDNTYLDNSGTKLEVRKLTENVNLLYSIKELIIFVVPENYKNLIQKKDGSIRKISEDLEIHHNTQMNCMKIDA